MWTRKELKQRAKAALKRNYWKIVLVVALSTLLGGGLSYSTSASGGKTSSIVAADTATEDEDYDMQIQEETLAEADMEQITEEDEGLSQEMDDHTKFIFGVSIVVFVLLFTMVLVVFMFAVMELLYNPFYIGVQRFMLKSVDDRSEIKEIVYCFDHSYKNVVKTMFHRDIRVLLWTLLFVIPGIYKKYQYRMVPYILAEKPDMDYKEALQMSKDMMDGEKWHAVILDFSFIPWHMLCMITCGIVGVFYVGPYVELTNASLYRALGDQERSVGKAGIDDGI